jgi:restriction system protein
VLYVKRSLRVDSVATRGATNEGDRIMSRRRSSQLEDSIEIAALLPWWLALILAVPAYFALHWLAAIPIPAATGVHESGSSPVVQLGTASVWIILKTVGLFGQYLVPAILALGALASALGQAKRKRLLRDAAAATEPNAAKALSWRDFEMLVGEAFRQQGYEVSETAEGADGGVDLELRKGGELHLVQCKQWRSYKVGVAVVRELYGVMAARGAAGGFVVSSGNYTKDAEEFARGRNIELINGKRLDRLIQSASDRRSPVKATLEPQETSSVPRCPSCGEPMVQRTAHRGQNAGRPFWGCSRFPACRGIRAL